MSERSEYLKKLRFKALNEVYHPWNDLFLKKIDFSKIGAYPGRKNQSLEGLDFQYCNRTNLYNHYLNILTNEEPLFLLMSPRFKEALLRAIDITQCRINSREVGYNNYMTWCELFWTFYLQKNFYDEYIEENINDYRLFKKINIFRYIESEINKKVGKSNLDEIVAEFKKEDHAYYEKQLKERLNRKRVS